MYLARSRCANKIVKVLKYRNSLRPYLKSRSTMLPPERSIVLRPEPLWIEGMDLLWSSDLRIVHLAPARLSLTRADLLVFDGYENSQFLCRDDNWCLTLRSGFKPHQLSNRGLGILGDICFILPQQIYLHSSPPLWCAGSLLSDTGCYPVITARRSQLCSSTSARRCSIERIKSVPPNDWNLILNSPHKHPD